MKLKEEIMSNGLLNTNEGHQIFKDSDVPLQDEFNEILNNDDDLNDRIECHLLEEKQVSKQCDQIPEGVSLLTDNIDCENEFDNIENRTCSCGNIEVNYWCDEEDDVRYSQLQCSKCMIDSPVRAQKEKRTSVVDSDENVHGDNNDSFNSVIENIPLAYNPTTRQLHVYNVQNSNAVDDDDASLKQSEAFLKDEKRDSQETCDKATCNVSLSRTDGSTFSSISSLSTNTDISASALSGNDLESCGTPTEKESQSKFRVDGENLTLFSESGAKSKRRGISRFLGRNLFSWKSKEPEQTNTSNTNLESNTYVVPRASGWKLLSKPIPTVHMAESEHSNPPSRESSYNLSADCLASSTTALILEDRPSNLPKKSAEESLKHRQEYESMVEAARKKEMKEVKERKKMQQQQLKQEEMLSNASRMWTTDILPNWHAMKSTKKVRDLWWQGIPPNVRGKIWKLAIGNDLNITEELYEICINRAHDRIRLAAESASICSEDVDSESTHDKEASVESIKLDVSRTFPHLCIFQKGGPYYDSLHSLLGAYVCYRPDVGYVQGMSFLAAILMLNIDIADAFICFSNLLNKPCQMAFFRLDEPVMKAYFLTYQVFFKENMPKLFSHFNKQNLTPDLYLMDWIYTLFSKSLPLDVASRVWDVFFRDGEEFLFRAALGILNLYKENLLEMEFIHLAQFLTKLPDNMSAEPLFKSIDSMRMISDKKPFSHILASHLTHINNSAI